MAKISLRVPDEDLAAIDEGAASAGVSRTDYLLRAVLDRRTADEQRLARIEDRLTRVEAAMFEN